MHLIMQNLRKISLISLLILHDFAAVKAEVDSNIDKSGTKIQNNLNNLQKQMDAEHKSKKGLLASFDETISTKEDTNVVFAENCCSPEMRGKHCQPKNPERPCIPCTYLPDEFLSCEKVEDIDVFGNETARSNGRGCSRYGGDNYDDVQKTWVYCTVLPDIECYGPRQFKKYNVPCIKYNGYYFLSCLLYSIFLGVIGVDRFFLGYSWSGVAKMLTLGGFGVWWVLDVIFLITGILVPADGSHFEPYH